MFNVVVSSSSFLRPICGRSSNKFPSLMHAWSRHPQQWRQMTFGWGQSDHCGSHRQTTAINLSGAASLFEGGNEPEDDTAEQQNMRTCSWSAIASNLNDDRSEADLRSTMPVNTELNPSKMENTLNGCLSNFCRLEMCTSCRIFVFQNWAKQNRIQSFGRGIMIRFQDVTNDEVHHDDSLQNRLRGYCYENVETYLDLKNQFFKGIAP